MEESKLNLENSWESIVTPMDWENQDIWLETMSTSINLDLYDSIDLSKESKPKRKLEIPSFFKKILKNKEKEALLEEDKIVIQDNSDNQVILNENDSNEDWNDIIVWPDQDNIWNNNINIFEELSDLNFFDSQNQEDNLLKKKLTPLEIILNSTSYIFYALLVINLLFFLHLYIKTTDSDIVSSIPWACYYVWSSIEWYDNIDCKTFPKIVEEITSNKDTLEKNIVKWLSILIPYKIKIDYVLSTPEVKFILDKKSAGNISFSKAMTEFEDIRQISWWFNWKNIECSNYSFDDKWIMNTSCDFYWSSINDWSNWFTSSRYVAIDFLKNLQSKNSNFQVMNYPKTIDIAKFNSADGIKTLFFTKTTLSLNLKYNLSSK